MGNTTHINIHHAVARASADLGAHTALLVTAAWNRVDPEVRDARMYADLAAVAEASALDVGTVVAGKTLNMGAVRADAFRAAVRHLIGFPPA